MSFQKTAVAVLASVVVFFKNRGCGSNAVVLKLITAVAVAVITYNCNSTKNWRKLKKKQGSGAEDSVGPHSGRLVLLWSTMKIWIAYFHF